jgi:hypothetical protein
MQNKMFHAIMAKTEEPFQREGLRRLHVFYVEMGTNE